MSSLRLTLILALFPFVVAAGEIHKWTDENGHVHFGDTPPKSVETTKIIVQPNIYKSPSIERNVTASNGSHNVVMYSAEWCGACKKARRYFIANNIPFTEYDVEKSGKGKRDYQRLKAKGVPVILVGKHRLNGFSQKAFENIYQGNAPNI